MIVDRWVVDLPLRVVRDGFKDLRCRVVVEVVEIESGEDGKRSVEVLFCWWWWEEEEEEVEDDEEEEGRKGTGWPKIWVWVLAMGVEVNELIPDWWNGIEFELVIPVEVIVEVVLDEGNCEVEAIADALLVELEVVERENLCGELGAEEVAAGIESFLRFNECCCGGCECEEVIGVELGLVEDEVEAVGLEEEEWWGCWVERDGIVSSLSSSCSSAFKVSCRAYLCE